MTPFIVTSEEERQAALKRLVLLAGFPAASLDAAERQALLEAVTLVDQGRAEPPHDLAC